MVYLLFFIFCQFVTGLVFLLSTVTKLQDFTQFTQSIANFRLLPRWLVPFSAVTFLGGEGLVLLLLLVQPSAAFFIGTMLLTIFTTALAFVLVRKIRTPCHCFGNSQRLITPIDLVRNAGFLLCTGVGWWLAQQATNTAELAPLNIGMIGLAALAFVVIWTQLGEIYELFQPSHIGHKV